MYPAVQILLCCQEGVGFRCDANGCPLHAYGQDRVEIFEPLLWSVRYSSEFCVHAEFDDLASLLLGTGFRLPGLHMLRR